MTPDPHDATAHGPTYTTLLIPLRDLGLTGHIEENADGRRLLRAPLPDGTRLSITSTHDLPPNPVDITGWLVQHEHADPHAPADLLYDSTPTGRSAAHSRDLVPLFAALIDWFRDHPTLSTPQIQEAVTATACHCVFAHPTSPAEHTRLRTHIDYARRIGDLHGLHLALVRLTSPCKRQRIGINPLSRHLTLPRPNPPRRCT